MWTRAILSFGYCAGVAAISACSTGHANTTGTSTGVGGSSATSGTGTPSSTSTTSGTATATSSGTGGAASACKRGIASNTVPTAAFSPGISWWYNWSLQDGGAPTSIAFVPMVWGSNDVGKPVPTAAKFLLGFNEPNFHAQSNLTPQQAAQYWPSLEATNLPLVSPAMNFCGPATACNGTSPYQYLKDFFAACPGCRVDYIAVHWYNCDLPSLKGYIEGNGSLEGFVQFGKPIWVTELACDNNATVAQQQAYMMAAIPYLESNPHVFRYSWFSADPIPNAKLSNPDGSPNALGQVYLGLPESCHP